MKKLKHFELVMQHKKSIIKKTKKYFQDTSLKDNYKTIITHKSQALKLRQLEKLTQISDTFLNDSYELSTQTC